MVPSQTGKEGENEAGQTAKDISQDKNAQDVSEEPVPGTVPAVMPNTTTPTNSDSTLTSPAVVETELTDTVVENAPAEESRPDTVGQSSQDIQARDAPPTDTPEFTLPAGLTPAVSRQLLAAEEQMQKTQGTGNLTPQKRK